MTGNVGENRTPACRTQRTWCGRAYSHEALEACREAASRCVAPRPLVLVGTPGSGRSLLLDGVSRYVRACQASAQIVHVSPERAAEGVYSAPEAFFPASAGPAILLVDRLDSFEPGADFLERLVRAFCVDAHAVICTSTAPPHLLPQLPHGLRRLLSDARCIPVAPLPVTGMAPLEGSPRLANEVLRLHRVLTALQSEVGKARLIERELRGEIERERALTTALSQALDNAKTQRRQERRQMCALHAELVRLHDVLARRAASDLRAGEDGARTNVDAWAVLESAKYAAGERARRADNEARVLRAENERLREEGDTLLARLWELSSDLAASRKRAEDLDRLRGAYAEQLTEVRERRLAAEDIAASARHRARELELAFRRAQMELEAMRKANATPAPANVEASRAAVSRCDAPTSAIIDALVSEKATAAVAARRAGATLERVEAELVRTRMEMDVLVEENERRLKALSAARERVAAMERAFTQRETEWAQWRAEGERSRQAIQRLYEQMRKLVAQRDALLRRVEELEACKATLDVALRTSESRADQAERSLGAAVSTQEELQKELESLRHAFERTRTQLAQTLAANGEKRRSELRRFMGDRRRPRIGEILVAAGNVRPVHLEEALRRQNGGGRPLGAILIERGYASKEAVAQAVARQAGVTFVRLSPDAVSAQAVGLLSADAARRHGCMPLRATARELTVAMADPLDQRARDAIAREARRRLRVLAAPEKDIVEAHQVYYAA